MYILNLIIRKTEWGVYWKIALYTLQNYQGHEKIMKQLTVTDKRGLRRHGIEDQILEKGHHGETGKIQIQCVV